MSKKSTLILTRGNAATSALPAYTTAPSNPIQNELSRVRENLPLEYPTSREGTVQVQHNSLMLEGAREAIYSLKPSTCIALDLLAEKLHSKAQEGRVEISVTEYAEARNLKDRKQAKQELIDFYHFAEGTVIYWDPKKLYKISKKGKVENRNSNLKGLLSDTELSDFALKGIRPFFKVAESGMPTRTGLRLTFTRFYSALISAFPPMLYHRVLARLNLNKYRASYHLGRYLSELINTHNVHNTVHKQPLEEEVKVSVLSLLSAAQDDIPSEDKVTGRHFRQQIITPIERNLDALADMGEWSYCHGADRGGAPVSREEASKLSYPAWKELYITFRFKGYLDAWRQRKLKLEAADPVAALAMPQETAKEADKE